jgi:NAD(P)-dependent dehydrogenase (short-subunit alcohol dehydrogenase family)
MERQGAIYPDLAGKTVIVTGGGSGIGESITRGFARQGSRVGFIDVAEEPSRTLAAELGDGVAYERADLTDVDALRRAIEAIRAALGPVDVLVNNAANDLRHRTQEVTSEFFDRMIAINLKQQFFCAQAVLPDMRAKRAGAIINFGSISWMQSKGGMAVYTAAKSAVLGLTRSLARDFGPDNIRVNAIAPGWIMTQRQIEKWLTPEALAETMQRQSLKRKLVPDDVAKVAVFLASEEASAITAQHYIVDGGWV